MKNCGVAQAGLPPPAPESRTFHRQPLQNRQNRMETETPQPNNPSPAAIPDLPTRHSRGGRACPCEGKGRIRPLPLPSSLRHSRGVGSEMRLGVNPSLPINHPQPRNSTRPLSAIPELPTRHSRAVGNPSLLNYHPQPRNSTRSLSVILSLPLSTKLEGSPCALAQGLPSVSLSPSPLMALRERGIKGVRVFSRGTIKQARTLIESIKRHPVRGCSPGRTPAYHHPTKRAHQLDNNGSRYVKLVGLSSSYS